MAVPRLPMIALLACVMTVTHQLPTGSSKSASLFNPQCFKDAYYFNVRCLNLLWDVSRHPVYGNIPTKRRKRDDDNEESDNEESDNEESDKKKRKRCRRKRLIDCPEYKKAIEDEFKAPDIECFPIQDCHVDVDLFISRCAVDENVRMVSKMY